MNNKKRLIYFLIICLCSLLEVGFSGFSIENGILLAKNKAFRDPQPGHSKKRKLRNRIISTAKKYLGVRYRYGGSSKRGFDCSGFVQYVFYKNGIQLPRTSLAQYRYGKRITRNSAVPGDLVFYKENKRRISHVGIYIGNNRFIHASSTGKKISIADMKICYWHERFAGFVKIIQ